MSGNNSQPGRTVASRMLAILDAFDFEHPRLSLSELARRADLSLPTTHRLVGELTSWRGLEREDDGKYRVGLHLLELGLLSGVHTRLRDVAMPFMQELYEATRENVHLAVRDGDKALYVEKLTGHRSVPIISRTGGRLPLHTTGVGKALLAWASPAVIDSHLGRQLSRPTRYSIREPGRLRRDLRRTRRRGFATTREEMTLGSCSVASPVLVDDEPVAAVGVVVRSSSLELDRLAPPVLAAARGIGARLAEAGDDPYPGYVRDHTPRPNR
ncbi:IclR family transcriptional regulator [Streptomyces abyssalis]|uniref:IclR family transcriptional regulator n=1 Tax=Streptomyces abyssalis TaxID=933944 RepID=A0A1E7JQD2_9ACTN|nr:IclR family transcriptional regulator [Streptomyces abyssalis]OEU95207.1 IclR family transcriptional regulator [Streptomyces abyssalis]OEV28660.1 IclR family transcriptional regulator [Streptomyces nanshensis]